MKPATDSAAYRSFCNARNAALERIHFRALAEINDIFRGFLNAAISAVAFRVSILPQLTRQTRDMIRALDLGLSSIIDHEAPKIAAVIREMRGVSYTLSMAGEVEAIGRASGKVQKIELDRAAVDAAKQLSAQDEDIESRVFFALSKVKRKIINAVEQSIVLEETVAECIERVRQSVPKYRLIARPKNPLQRVREADNSTMQATRTRLATDESGPIEMISGFIDDEAWENVLDWYRQEYTPKIKIDEMLVDPRSPTFDRELQNEQFYSWEIEQYTTHEFVQSVRSGQNEAANQAGVKDFIWVAIVDDRTDTCCLWRDGLSSAEIESKLKTSHKDDDCKVLVPPAHFNCRCDMAPMLKDMPEVEPSNLAEFQEWLTT